jgi:Tfp pilus assembly protein PilF
MRGVVMKKRLFALCVITLLGLSVAAQKLEPPKLQPTPTTEKQQQIIREGEALHDNGDYDGAIARYQEVLKENPNNVEALYETAFSYYKKKDYPKSIEIGYQAAKYKSDLLAAIYVQIGSSYDEAGDPKKAIEVYKAGIKLNPRAALLHYNLAITYYGSGQLEDARSAAKRAAILNPNHPSTQILLSSLFEKGSYKTPALLAACRFLILEPDSRRSEVALRTVEKVMQAGVSPTNEKEIKIFIDTSPKKDEGDFSSIEMFMGLARAANYTEKNRDKSPAELVADNFNSLFAYLAESRGKADKSKFTWRYYVPYFAELKSKGYVEVFTYYTHQRSAVPEVAEWLRQNKSKVAGFLAWSKAYSWPKD